MDLQRLLQQLNHANASNDRVTANQIRRVLLGKPVQGAHPSGMGFVKAGGFR